jgi:hypothetical protein
VRTSSSTSATYTTAAGTTATATTTKGRADRKTSRMGCETTAVIAHQFGIEYPAAPAARAECVFTPRGGASISWSRSHWHVASGARTIESWTRIKSAVARSASAVERQDGPGERIVNRVHRRIASTQRATGVGRSSISWATSPVQPAAGLLVVLVSSHALARRPVTPHPPERITR